MTPPKRPHCDCGHCNGNQTQFQRVIDLGECAKCGEVHRHCSGHVYGRPCAKVIRLGQLVCTRHGGNAPQNLAKAERTLAEEAAQKAVARLSGDSTPVTDPAAELARLAGEIRAWDRAATELVDQLQSLPATVDSETGEAIDPTGSGIVTLGTSGFDVHPLVKLAERSKDRSRAVLADMVKLGLVERHIALEESQTMLMHQALTAALTEAGIDPATVLPVLAVKLRELDAIDADGGEV